MDSIVLSFKYFNDKECMKYTRDVYAILTKAGRFVEYVRFAVRTTAIFSPVFHLILVLLQENMDATTLESTKTFMYSTIVDTLKLLMTGRRDQVHLQNTSREAVMTSILNEV